MVIGSHILFAAHSLRESSPQTLSKADLDSVLGVRLGARVHVD